MNIKRILKILLITLPIIGILTIIGNMIFWSIAMGKAETNSYNSSIKEKEFIEHIRNTKRVNLDYPPLPHNDKIHYLDIMNYDSIPPKHLSNRNIKPFCDSIYSNLMNIYSLKDKVDSIAIHIHLNNVHKMRFPYKIDTTFYYKVEKK